MTLLATLISLTIGNSALAQDAVDLTKGQPAPMDGTLMSKAKAKKIQQELIEADNLQDQNDSLNKSVGLYKANEQNYLDQNKLLLNQNVELTKTVMSTRETSEITKAFWFFTGIVVTGAAVYGASRLK